MLYTLAMLLGLLSPLAARGDWDLSKPTGKASEALNGYFTRVRGLPTSQSRTDLEVEETLTNGTFTARATPWAWLRAPEAVGAQPRRKHKAFVELKEGWGEFASTAVDVRIGNQIIAWGAADQINPTDVWNPKDLYDPFQSAKLPITALKINVHPAEVESLALETIFTPFFRPTRLPIALPEGATQEMSLSDSRWLLPFPNMMTADGFTAPLNYQVSEPTYPKTWQAGARLKVMRVGGWDFAAMAFNGVELLPRMAVTRRGSPNNPTLPVTLTLHPSFHRQSVYGVDGAGSVTIGDMDIGTRFEAAYIKHSNDRVKTAPQELQSDLFREDDLFTVAGLDYTFKRNVLSSVLYVNLIYVHFQNIGNTEHAAGQYVVQGLPTTQVWDDNLVLYWENRFGPRFKFSNSAIGSFKNADGLITPGVHYEWTDNFKTSVTADFFVGRTTGFFGQFKDNRRATLLVSYSF